MKEECIPLDAPSAWIEALQGIPHAFGHTWENCYSMYLSTGHSTFLYTFKEREVQIVCPIAERSYQGYIDIVTPYGFSGFVGNAPCADFPGHWERFASQRGYVCGYIGLNPLLYNTSYFRPEDAYSYNLVYALDLTMGIDELFSRLSTNRKRQVSKASRSANLIEETDRLLEFLLRHYIDFYREKNASSVYHFVPDTFIELAKKDNVILVGTEGPEGVNSVMMFAYTPYIGEYLLNVSLPEGQQYSVALLWYGVRKLMERKVAWLNLGGGIRPGDGVAQFKERFGGKVFPMLSLKQVYHVALFRQLCQKAQANPDDLSGYFPPYWAKK